MNPPNKENNGSQDRVVPSNHSRSLPYYPPHPHGYHPYAYSYPYAHYPTNYAQPHMPSSSNQRYFLDAVCHPTSELPNSFMVAKELLLRHYGGFCEGDQVIMSNGIRNNKNGDKIHRFYCRVSNLNNGFRCGWLGQIREFPDGKCAVYTRPAHNYHRHTMEPVPSHPKEQFGIHPSLAIMIDRYTQNDTRSIMNILPMTLLSHLTHTVRTDPNLSHCRYMFESRDHYGHTKLQVASFLRRRREEFMKRELMGNTSIANVDSMRRILRLWSLNIPDDYHPTTNYNSPKELSKALKLSSTFQMLAYDLSCGPVHDVFKRKAVPKSAAMQKKFDEKMEFAFFIFSATGLYQLLNLATRRVGTRSGNVDGTHGLCREDVTISFGSTSVKLRVEYDDVTSSYRVVVYLRAGGERRIGYFQGLISQAGVIPLAS